MNSGGMRIVVLGLSLSSSWGDGHATTYRALLKAMAERGHDILFLERNVPWYAGHRDMSDPDYCKIQFYDDVDGLHRHRKAIAQADAVIVGSYVPEGIEVIQRVLAMAGGLIAFYDIDTPVTLATLEAGTCEYVATRQIPRLDLYLSFTGGPLLQRIAFRYGARRPVALYCSVDADEYRPMHRRRKWDLGYLGTYSADRQPALERLLLEPARRRPDLRFVVAGAQYPSTASWPQNVEHVTHLAPSGHASFYSSMRWALNVTRSEMVRAGYSPSVRLFEAAACATPILSDSWPGLDSLFTPGREIMIAEDTEAALSKLTLPASRRRRLGTQARARVLGEHTSRHRAAELELLLLQEATRSHGAHLRSSSQAGAEPNQPTYVSTRTVLT